MSFGFPTAFGPAAPALPEQRPNALRLVGPDDADAIKGVDKLLKDDPEPLLTSGPPDDVLAEVDRAHDVMERLAADNIEMRFDVDSRTGEITVQLRDGNGETVRTITLVEAMDVASGDVDPEDAGLNPVPRDADKDIWAARADVYDAKGRLK